MKSEEWQNNDFTFTCKGKRDMEIEDRLMNGEKVNIVLPKIWVARYIALILHHMTLCSARNSADENRCQPQEHNFTKNKPVFALLCELLLQLEKGLLTKEKQIGYFSAICRIHIVVVYIWVKKRATNLDLI